MTKYLALAILLLAAWAGATHDVGGQPTPQPGFCATRPTGDNTNACASTAFVQNTIGGSGSALPSGEINIGNSLNTAQPQVISGACTISNTGVLTCFGTSVNNLFNLGTVTSGIWQATPISSLYIGWTPILNSTVTSTSITGVSTITSGIWNGTAITGSNIANTTITAANIANNTLTSTQIQAASITSASLLQPSTRNLLQSQSAANVANLQFTTPFTSAYSTYEIEIYGLLPVTTEALPELQVIVGGSARNSGYLSTAAQNVGSAQAATAVTTYIPLGYTTANTNAAANTGPGYVGKFTLFTSGYAMAVGDSTWISASGSNASCLCTGVYNTQTGIGGIEILFSSGNINTGTVNVYGVN